MVIISSPESFLLMLWAFSGHPDKLKKTNIDINVSSVWGHFHIVYRVTRLGVDSQGSGCPLTDLLCVANTLLAWPRPLQPGRGQWGSSCLQFFQEKAMPFSSFCLFAATGQLPALRWEVYFPDTWPCPSQPTTGHLRKIRISHVWGSHFAWLAGYITSFPKHP